MQHPSVRRTRHEDRIVERVHTDAVGVRCLLPVPGIDNRLVTDIVGCCDFLDTEVRFIAGIELLYLDSGHSMVDTVILAGVALHIESQVERLAHLALLEQSGIALSGNLNDLILGGMQC